MGASFDAYYKWLAIPPEDQPPHHYRLLGLKLFESDPDVIEASADRQMTHVRSYQAGRHADLSQRLLNEIAAAKRVLLDAPSKADYDAQLKRERDNSRQKGLQEVALPTAQPPARATETASGAARAEPSPALAGPVVRPAPSPRSRSSQPLLLGGIAAAVALLLVAGIALALLRPWAAFRTGREARTQAADPHDSPPTESNRNDETSEERDDEEDQALALLSPPSEPPARPKPSDETGSNAPPTAEQPEPTDDPEKSEEPKPEEEPKTKEEPKPPVGLEPEGPQKLSIPSNAERAAARKRIDAIYPVDQADSMPAKAEMAGRLMQTARDTRDDAVAKFVLWNMARELAAAAGDIHTALAAIAELDAQFAIDADAVRFATFRDAAGATVPPAAKRATISAGLEMIDRLVADNRYREAAALAELLLKPARKTDDRGLLSAVLQRRRSIEDLHDQFQHAEAAFDALRQDPEDAEANLVAGKFAAFVKGDWKTGLPLLARGSDRQLRAAASAELDDAAQPQEMLRIADTWWQEADRQSHPAAGELRWRAKSWYRKALPSLDGVDSARVRQRLLEISDEELADISAALQPSTVLRMTFDRKTYARAGNKLGVKDLSGRNNHGAIHGATVVAGAAGEALSFKGRSFVDCGNSSSLQPDKDFSISLWVYPIKGPDYPRIVSKYGTYQLRWKSYYTDPGPLRFVGQFGTLRAPRTPAYEKWHHMVVTYGAREDGGRLRMYHNGALLAEQPTGRPGAGQPDGHLYLGVSKHNHQYEHYKGLIDELTILNRELTARQIDAFFCATAPRIPAAALGTIGQ